MTGGKKRDQWKGAYSKAENALIREFYNQIPNVELLARINKISSVNRSMASLRAKAQKLGVAGNAGNRGAIQAQNYQRDRTPRQQSNYDSLKKHRIREQVNAAPNRGAEIVFSGLALFDPMLRRVAKEKALGLEPKSLLRFNNDGSVAYHFD